MGCAILPGIGDSEDRTLYMGAPALRAPARARESLPLREQEPAGQALKGPDDQCFSSGGGCFSDMPQVHGHFFFRDADHL